MVILILSYFDRAYGPKIFFQAPESISTENLNRLPRLLDLYEDGFFGYTFGEFKSYNLVFKINSQYGRGNMELFLISLLITY